MEKIIAKQLEISKLPVRQVTHYVVYALLRYISKLPVRQVTNVFD